MSYDSKIGYTPINPPKPSKTGFGTPQGLWPWGVPNPVLEGFGGSGGVTPPGPPKASQAWGTSGNKVETPKSGGSPPEALPKRGVLGRLKINEKEPETKLISMCRKVTFS